MKADKIALPAPGKLKRTGEKLTVLERTKVAGIPTYEVRFGRERQTFNYNRNQVVLFSGDSGE